MPSTAPSADTPTSTSPSNYLRGVSLVALGLAIALWGLGSKSLWSDEIVTAQLTRQPFRPMWQAMHTDPNHLPLYFLLQWAFSWLGRSEWAIRLVSAFLATATVAAIYLAGATPAFVDIDPTSYTIDPSQIEAAITPRTKAILPVHLYGQAADMESILAIARRYNLKVIEDAAQAHGAKYKGQPVGSLGDIACFSFYPTKVLGGYGDGGLVVTDSEELYQRVLELRVYGAQGESDRKVVGTNSRLDEIQASVLRVKLKYLEQWIKERRERAEFYHQELSSLPLQLPRERAGIRHTYNSYVIRTEKRDEMVKVFQEKKIGYAIYYQRPFHKYSCFQMGISSSEKFPNAEKRSTESLALPIFPELTEKEQKEVINIIKNLCL